MRAEFPSSEVVYRSALQIMGGHSTALERLGRVYLRYRETIPAAVQCFFKSVETNPSNHVAWYLLGRCYMATAQYSDACEAYNRAINLNPNDPQVWCSLGVLYYAFGQYREALGMLARALKLDPTMADAWYNVGALYDMCDQPEDAQQAYLKARENGLADRFARAGMGLNPLAMQSMQQSYSANNNQSNHQSGHQPQQSQSNSAQHSSSQHHHHDVDDHDHHDLGDIMMSHHVDEAVADYIAGTADDDDVGHDYH
jgi:Flp pilus assembly protein TadD